MTQFLAIAGMVGLLGAGTGWMAMSEGNTTRADCLGKITCPQTGEVICADQCPLMEAIPARCRE